MAGRERTQTRVRHTHRWVERKRDEERDTINTVVISEFKAKPCKRLPE